MFSLKIFLYHISFVLFIIVKSSSGATTFTDDLGTEHTFPDDRPAKIVVSSYGARGLRHFGLNSEDVVATYHTRLTTGSNTQFLDPTGYNGTEFPANPSAEELVFLSQIEDLSSACNTITSCNILDIELFRSLAEGVDFVIMEGFRHQVGLFGEYVQEIEEIIGKPIILIDVSLAGPNCLPDAADRCYGKSFIDIAKQLEELALFLKYTPPSTLEEDKKLLCEVSQEFQAIAAGAHDRGVRVMAAYLGDQGLIPMLPEANVNYFANPPDDNVLRMLEELGMPLLHPYCNSPNEDESCPFDGYYWETVLTERYFGCNSTDPSELAKCADNTFYPVDMWLYDHRSTQWVTNPAFAEVFPDKAFVERQIAFWPIGGLHAVSYRFAAEILQEIGPVLERAKRVHDTTECTKADVSGEAHRTVGLPQGTYACYDRQYHNEDYLTCPTEESGLSTGAIVGIVVGGVVLFVALLMVASALSKRTSGTEFDSMDPTVQKVRNEEEHSEGQGSAMDTSSAATSS